MAVLDSERGLVVVRLVYDGPPLAGKTTSIRALGRSLVRHVETPQEIDGRTVFFDWMEYTAGLFEGHQIRCQIVSVPGQPNLAPRRKALLLSADAVVFVADTSTPEAAERSADYVKALTRLTQEVQPPVGVVVQANKRDAPHAVPIPRLRAVLGNALSGVAITESVAHEAQGTRETFVLAVRLALDRVRDLVARGKLPRGRPDIDSADELLKSFEALGSMTEKPIDPEPVNESTRRSVASPPRERAPRLPDVRVPSGAIWPAVDGRLILHEAVSGALRPRRSDRDAWVAGTGTGWRIHSAAEAQFSEFDAGREAVVLWARAHSARIGLLSPGRCIVVADAGDGAWRLWQIVRVLPSLRRWLLDLACDADSSALLEALSIAARTLFEAATHPKMAGLPATFDNVGLGETGAQVVGLMPGPGSESEPNAAPDPEAGLRRLHTQLETLLHFDLGERLQDLRAAANDGRSTSARDQWRVCVTEVLESVAAG
ncbi:MAG: hypothetical protein ABW061_16810 [Polyangiaceae bacterium]